MSDEITRIWRDDILPTHPVPSLLHPWQTDALSLILQGCSVALCVPTGSGKSLPQLTASLFFTGKFTDSYLSIVKHVVKLC